MPKVKDNRVLPRGFDKATAHADIAVHGKAQKDPNFAGGQDRIQYVIEIENDVPPFCVRAKLWYQPIAYRWAQNLDQYRSPETKRFVQYYNSMSADSALLLTEDREKVK